MQITDTYTSVDGLSHALDVRYGQDFEEANAGFNFPWVDGSTYNTHAVGDTEPAPPSVTSTMYVNWNNSLPDGAENSAQGAITFGTQPNGFEFLSSGLNGHTHLYVSYARTIPAAGSVKLTTTYSWAFTIADVQALVPFATGSGSQVASTGGASAITSTSATISGSVNPNGRDTSYHFEYGTTPSYGSSTAVTDDGSGTTANLVFANLTGLTPGTQYYYRLVGTDSNGNSYGSQATFTTTQPPTVSTGVASSITTTAATIAGSVNPNGLDTSYHFEYGTTPSYGTSTTTTDDGNGTTSATVTANLAGLTPGTQYYYRLVATSVAGTTDGTQGTFTTTQPPTVSTGVGLIHHHHRRDDRRIGQPQRAGHQLPLRIRHHPQLRQLDGGDRRRQRHDQRHRHSQPGRSNPGHPVLLPAGRHQRRRHHRRHPGHLHHHPAAHGEHRCSLIAITNTTATIAGSVNPNGLDTSYHFEYGTTPSYGSSTAVTDDGSGTTSGTVTANLAGLTPGTQYYYRLVATSVAGTTDGSQATFTTAPEPPTVSTGSAAPITNTTATIAGSVNPNGQDTSYHFEYGTTPSYGTSTTDHRRRQRHHHRFRDTRH